MGFHAVLAESKQLRPQGPPKCAKLQRNEMITYQCAEINRLNLPNMCFEDPKNVQDLNDQLLLSVYKYLGTKNVAFT